jgi:hypothetical protein
MYEPWPQRIYPPTWRIVLAFLVAPTVGAALLALIAPAYGGLPPVEQFLSSAKVYALVGAYPTTLLFGVPAYFMARRHFEPRPLSCAIVGGVVAAFPWLILMLVPIATSAGIGGRATVIDGSYTAYGWLMNGLFVGQIAAVGFVAGLAFWITAAAGLKPPNVR